MVVLLSAPMAGAALAEQEVYGSLYPSDEAPSVLVQPVPPGPSRDIVFVANSALEKALGPAGYLVGGDPLGAAFNAKVRQAIGRHPAFHAEASNVVESTANRRRARAALLPQLSGQLNGDYSITRDFAAGTDNVVESLRPREQFTAGVSASQLIFDGGATIQRIRSARAQDEEYKNALSTRVNDLALRALTAYYDVAAHQALMALGGAFIERHQEILANVKEREQLGAGSRADVTRAKARLAAAKARLAGISESKRFADIRYEEFFGDPPATLARPAVNAPGLSSRNEAIAAALSTNPQIAGASARADARRADFKAAKGARLPEVRLSVDAVKFDVFDGGDDFDVRAGVNLNYNIFGGGARAADIAIARSRAQRERFNAEQVRQEIASDAAMAYERLAGADETLDALGDAVIAHDETRDLVLERYQLSRGDLIDVLQSENDYFEAAVAYLIGLSGRDMASFALMEHTGDLLVKFSPENEYHDALSGGRR